MRKSDRDRVWACEITKNGFAVFFTYEYFSLFSRVLFMRFSMLPAHFVNRAEYLYLNSCIFLILLCLRWLDLCWFHCDVVYYCCYCYCCCCVYIENRRQLPYTFTWQCISFDVASVALASKQRERLHRTPMDNGPAF